MQYGTSLQVFSSISHEWAQWMGETKLTTRRDIPSLQATMYYFVCYIDLLYQNEIQTKTIWTFLICLLTLIIISNLNFILTYNIEVLITTFLMTFRRFPTTFQRFQKIFQNLSKGQKDIFQKYKIDHTPTNLSVVKKKKRMLSKMTSYINLLPLSIPLIFVLQNEMFLTKP